MEWLDCFVWTLRRWYFMASMMKSLQLSFCFSNGSLSTYLKTITLRNFVKTDLVNKIILAEQGQPDVFHEGGKMLGSRFNWVLDPGNDALKHLEEFLVKGLGQKISRNLLPSPHLAQWWCHWQSERPPALVQDHRTHHTPAPKSYGSGQHQSKHPAMICDRDSEDFVPLWNVSLYTSQRMREGQGSRGGQQMLC